ncbi:MAG TPA: hypothetical protein VF525_00740 [Pyrinomonadaceae bacterium]|jgi:hypothetical protein
MEKISQPTKPTLVFVYNADGGIFNTFTDVAHKIFSPQTYPCNLCALTHTLTGMRKEWRQFLDSLDRSLEFLHANELSARYGVANVPLPAIFKKDGEGVELLVGADSINKCRTMADLKNLILNRCASEGYQ